MSKRAKKVGPSTEEDDLGAYVWKHGLDQLDHGEEDFSYLEPNVERHATLLRFLVMNLFVPSPNRKVRENIDAAMALIAKAWSIYLKEYELGELRYYRIYAANALGSIYKNYRGPQNVPTSELQLFLSRFLNLHGVSDRALKSLRRTKQALTDEAGARGGDAVEKFGGTDLAAENIASLLRLFPEHRFSRNRLGSKLFRQLTNKKKSKAYMGAHNWDEAASNENGSILLFLKKIFGSSGEDTGGLTVEPRNNESKAIGPRATRAYTRKKISGRSRR